MLSGHTVHSNFSRGKMTVGHAHVCLSSVTDEIENGVFVFLKLFIDDGITSLKKLNVEFFNQVIRRLLLSVCGIRKW